MKKRKVLIGLIIGFIIIPAGAVAASVAYVFRENIAPLEVRELPRKNPTSHVFETDLKTARQKIIDGFSLDSQFANREIMPFKDARYSDEIGSYESPKMVRVETADEEFMFSEAEEIFKDPANQNDIYIHGWGDTIDSHSYFVLGKPLAFRIRFHIHLEADQTGKTRVSVSPVNPTVVKGISGLGPHGWVAEDVPVPPTTIEEYQLLRYVGHILGEKEMPPVIFPE